MSTESPGLVCLTFIMLGAILVAVSKMFEYSLQTIIGRDVPWYMDLLGGIVLNVINLPLFVVCLIANYLGVDVPWVVL